MRFRILTLILAVTLVAACGDDTSPLGGSDGGSTGSTGDVLGGGDIGGSGDGDQASPMPVPIREGLASFDAYVFTTRMVTAGPGPSDRVDIEIRSEFDRATDSAVQVATTTQNGADFDEPLESRTRMRRVGNQTCTDDGEGWTYSEASAQQREILELGQRQVDLSVVPESPVEVGREDVAGIPAIHYTFTPSGFGTGSGAVTDVRSAEYWVSVDGNVLLRYDMVAESRSGPTDDPDTEVFTVEIHMELVDTVGPGAVNLPEECLAQQGA